MRLAFAGTPEFAASALERLLDEGHEVALVLSQPDRPAGRGMKTASSTVKALALARGLAVAQPRGLRLDGRFADDAAAARDALLHAAPRAIVVAAYGLILPPWLLEMPALGCLNIHASLLPRWRGAAPIQRAIEAGDAETGVTIMQMDAGLDTGAMLRVRSTSIDADDTAASLQTRLAALGAELVVESLEDAAAGRLVAQPQPDIGITYAAKIAKAEAAIDWHEPAATIERRLRAFDPFPGARGTLGAESVTCWRGHVRASMAGPPGDVLAIDHDALVVACGVGALALTELQRPGGRRLPASEFLRGLHVDVGARFAISSKGG